jgi:hypothetical protein
MSNINENLEMNQLLAARLDGDVHTWYFWSNLNMDVFPKELNRNIPFFPLTKELMEFVLSRETETVWSPSDSQAAYWLWFRFVNPEDQILYTLTFT